MRPGTHSSHGYGRRRVLPDGRFRLALVLLCLLTGVGLTIPAAAASTRQGAGSRAVTDQVSASSKSGSTLAQAPVALQAAVRETLGVRAAAADGTWSKQAVLTAANAAGRDFFGTSVAISGALAVVGADDVNNTHGVDNGSGAAYVFAQSGTTWSEQAELTDPQELTDPLAAEYDYFGYSVAISGSTVVVGAYGVDFNTGAAYVFAQSGTTWSEQAELTSPEPSEQDLFGYGVAVSGSTAVVGANSGTYVFARSGTSWAQQATLADTGDEVAISGSTVLANGDAGVDVFTRSGTTWSQQAVLADPDPSPDDIFGNSIAISASGSTAVVGVEALGSSTGPATSPGMAYVFTRAGTTWSEQAELTGSGSVPQDYFGVSVAISGSTVVVGASGNGMLAGAAYVFTQKGTTWSELQELSESDATAYDEFGFSVALSGSTLMAGVPGYGSTASGAVYVYGGDSGCEQVTAPDGDYEFSGCVTQEDDGTLDVTSQQSDLDGVQVSASAADEVSYNDGDSAGDTLTSTAPSTLSLSLGSTLIDVFSGVLDEPLTEPITVQVAAGTQIAGLTMSGSLTLTPDSGGQATGSVTVTLPPVLGGGTGTLTFTTTVAEGLSSVQVSVPQATFMGLFSLSDVSLAYTPGTRTWSVSATATTGGGTSAPFSGSLTYSEDTLSAASLEVGGISLAGLTDISSLKVSYKQGTWSGSAEFTNPAGGAEKATITLGFTGGTLTSGSITAADVALFGAVDVAGFSMSYASGSWELSVTTTLPGGGGGSTALTVSGGIVTAASLTLTDVSFEGKFTVASATISYSASAPNAACGSVTGTEIWCGSWQVQLPQATTIDGVSGTLAFSAGTFASGSIDVSGHVPLIDGLFLTGLGAALTVNPPPTTITGTADIAFGPTVNGTTLLSAVGTLTRTMPGSGTSGSYTATGALSALSEVLGTATVTVPGDGAKTTIDLTLGSSPATGLSFSKLGVTIQVTGELAGSFSASSFSVTGAAQVAVNGSLLAGGSMEMNGDGMAACATTSRGKVGFEYAWSTGDLSLFGTKGCSEQGF
jgi:FG-GAP repeat